MQLARSLLVGWNSGAHRFLHALLETLLLRKPEAFLRKKFPDSPRIFWPGLKIGAGSSVSTEDPASQTGSLVATCGNLWGFSAEFRGLSLLRNPRGPC